MAWVAKAAHGVAAFDFVEAGKYQISLQVGDEVKIAKEAQDWYKGVNLRTGEEGIFPTEFIDIITPGETPKKKKRSFTLGVLKTASVAEAKAAAEKRHQREKKGANPAAAADKAQLSDEPVTTTQFSDSDSLLFNEIAIILQECAHLIKTHLMTQNYEEYYNLQNQISTLLEWRRQLEDPATPTADKDFFRASVLKLIEASRKVQTTVTVCVQYLVPHRILCNLSRLGLAIWCPGTSRAKL
jgi:hypothetical protein